VRGTAGAAADATIAFCIPLDHPALPGHFPGAPVVPGALLLAEGLRRLESAVGAPIVWRRIECAKFLRPVAAGDSVTAALTMTGSEHGRVEFSVAGRTVAELTFVAEPPAGQSVRE
jgi:3-hydroxymyristoyl/3-hydroxydecanoyl-(acyl carrier protein) dehydratase